jgi:hypothetical protein
LPDGEQIRSHLVQALDHSVAADRAFAAWADEVARGSCGHDGNYRAGEQASTLAQAAKRRFCAAWNTVAAGMGLRTRSQDEV